MSDETKIGVGSTVWVQDGVYGQIAWNRWTERKITGETRVSWIIGQGWNLQKFPKKVERGEFRWTNIRNSRNRVALTMTERDDRVFVEINASRIGSQVSACTDACILRQISTLIGYAYKEPSSDS